MLKKTLLATGLLGLALSASQPAFAKTRVVSYADLDLATKQGQAELNKRLSKAAKHVCGLDKPDYNSAEFEAAQQCFHKSYAQAKKARTGLVQTASAAAR
ncbi:MULTISPECIES: UrcA family protein [unclassified Novosphingobium]|uniref:UrcA family protein n=1 Tax=unclassified Novosphingobium TaxID=2644732 RepID=UPI0025E1448F|nr:MULTISPECIES: UrcA family protein [unclassified Novosphingobium]HQS68444.1 UrcA family protein [Novosphingobium sp.]